MSDRASLGVDILFTLKSLPPDINVIIDAYSHFQLARGRLKSTLSLKQNCDTPSEDELEFDAFSSDGDICVFRIAGQSSIHVIVDGKRQPNLPLKFFWNDDSYSSIFLLVHTKIIYVRWKKKQGLQTSYFTSAFDIHGKQVSGPVCVGNCLQFGINSDGYWVDIRDNFYVQFHSKQGIFLREFMLTGFSGRPTNNEFFMDSSDNIYVWRQIGGRQFDKYSKTGHLLSKIRIGNDITVSSIMRAACVPSTGEVVCIFHSSWDNVWVYDQQKQKFISHPMNNVQHCRSQLNDFIFVSGSGQVILTSTIVNSDQEKIIEFYH